MISFLNIDNFIKGLKPVTSSEYFIKADEFHPEGLFSETIFGVVNSIERKKTFSYVDLHAEIIHPTALEILLRLDRKIEKFIAAEENFKLDGNGMLTINPSGVTGISEFIKLFPKIKFRTGTEAREKFVELMTKEYKEKRLFLTKLPIIPPEYRAAFKDEETGEWTIDKLNEIYQGIIRRTFQLRSAGSGPLYDLLNYALQKAIIDYNKYIKSRVEKKHGLIRQNMLAKRVDFSARAVITPSPELKVDEVGIPFRMAISIFEPFIIHKLLHTNIINKDEFKKEVESYTGVDFSIDSVLKIMKGIKSEDIIPEKLYEMFFVATEAAIEGRVVLVKRDPVLHTASYQAYRPIIHKGSTVQLCTMQVGPHNADFDGDSCLLSIIYQKKDQNIKCHISEFIDYENFKFISEKEKQNGIVVKKYKPIDELYITSIDHKTGNIKKKRITEYSIHENIDMYKIHDPKNRFEDFWSSYDHSLIIYDENKNEIRKISPKELLEAPANKYFIRKRKNEIE